MNRLDIAYYQPLEVELKQLELVKGLKVDHPPQGSKDVADALCGAVYSCVKNNMRGFGISN